MRTISTLFFCLIVVFSYAQDQSDDSKRAYRQFQHQLDKQHCGLGYEFSKPKLGSEFTVGEKWTGFNILADIAEIKFGFGRVSFTEPEYGASGGPLITTDMHAKYISFGVNLPIKLGAIGFQGNAFKQFRGHPFIGGSLNWMRFKPESNNSYNGRIFNFTASPGYRFRIPFGSIDLGINLNLGLEDGLGGGFVQITSVPYVALRFDALKTKLKPEVVALNYVSGSPSDIKFDEKTYTDYSPSGYKTRYTETKMSYKVNAGAGRFGFQDMGYFLGIGPRFGINNLASEKIQPRGYMAGISAHARASLLYLGLNFETGKMGHATTMKFVWEYDEKKIDQNKTWGKGTYNNTKIFTDIGIDITPLLFAATGTGISDYSSITPFTTLMFGTSFGHSIIGEQNFESSTSNARYEEWFALNSSFESSKLNDPRKGKSGLVRGWVVAIQLGALEFRMQMYKFKNSPLANNKVLSIVYRKPIIWRKN